MPAPVSSSVLPSCGCVCAEEGALVVVVAGRAGAVRKVVRAAMAPETLDALAGMMVGAGSGSV